MTIIAMEQHSQLPLSPTDAQLRALTTLRAILRRAKARGATEGERIETVILSDFVAESVIKLAAEALGVETPKEAPLGQALGGVSAAFRSRGANLAYRSRVEHLRDVRNLVQHRGEVPGPATASRAVEDVQAFAENLIAVLWGLALEQLSRVEMIEDERLKLLMRTAEAALAQSNRDDALFALSLSLLQRAGCGLC